MRSQTFNIEMGHGNDICLVRSDRFEDPKLPLRNDHVYVLESISIIILTTSSFDGSNFQCRWVTGCYRYILLDTFLAPRNPETENPGVIVFFLLGFD